MSSPSDLQRSNPPRAYLLYGATVLTLNDKAEVVRGAEILVQHGRIAAIGRAITAAPGTQMIDLTGHVVMPGLVQGHIHLGQTFFRGLAEDRQLLAWLRERIWPLEAAHDDESAYWCSLLGAAECLLSGTTTVQDIGIGPGARGNLKAIRNSRLRALAGQCLMDSGDGLPENMAGDTDRVLAATEELGDKFDGSNGRLRYALNPRFILSCSDEMFRGIRELAEKRSWPIHTHALEQKEETELVRSLKSGRDEVEYFDEMGILSSDLRIAHGIWINKEDYPRLANQCCSVVHCPSSNLKLGSGIADVVGLKKAGIAVGLGTDGAPCNNDLDAFEELKLAALLQKLQSGPDRFSGLDALRLATSEGARALGLEKEVGSVEVGKRADLVVLTTDSPEMWSSPQADLHDLVAFGASRAHVRHVFVDGEHLVNDGRLTHLDLPEIRQEADRSCQALLDRSGLNF